MYLTSVSMPLIHMPSSQILYLPDLSPHLKYLKASRMAQATYPSENKSCALHDFAKLGLDIA